MEEKVNRSLIYEIFKTVISIALIFVTVRYFIVQPFLVDGSSMEPNFHDGQYLFVNELKYKISSPKRGDVIVFKKPGSGCTEHVKSNFVNRIFIQGPCKNYIKRIVGTPGEKITIKDGQITVANTKNPEGFTLNETSYIPADMKLFGTQTVVLQKNEYYVIGDNRSANGSSDSREWGPVPRAFITGKAWLTIFPASDFGFTPKAEY